MGTLQRARAYFRRRPSVAPMTDDEFNKELVRLSSRAELRRKNCRRIMSSAVVLLPALLTLILSLDTSETVDTVLAFELVSAGSMLIASILAPAIWHDLEPSPGLWSPSGERSVHSSGVDPNRYCYEVLCLDDQYQDRVAAIAQIQLMIVALLLIAASALAQPAANSPAFETIAVAVAVVAPLACLAWFVYSMVEHPLRMPKPSPREARAQGIAKRR